MPAIRVSSLAALCVASALAVATPACAPPPSQPATAPAPPAPIAVDFDALLRGVRFDPASLDMNLDASFGKNGILDADEMALVAAVLAQPALDLHTSGGVTHAQVRAAWEQARASGEADKRPQGTRFAGSAEITAGYAMLGRASFESFDAMSVGSGTPLRSDYSLALDLDRYLAFSGDADGDGASNLAEYRATVGQGRAAYLAAALDPNVRPPAGADAGLVPAPTPRKTLGIVLYPGFEVLDVFGPIEMWSYVPDFKVITVAQAAGPVRSAQGISAVADYSFETAPPLDILMVPGGVGTRAELVNPVLLDYLRQQHARTQYTTSVCTGSALLAKAGLLKGLKATSNKGAFQLAVDQDPDVQWMPKARWVEDGKVLTSSGVSAGTDMALGLVAKIHGKAHAQALAKSLEYEWNGDADRDPFAITMSRPAR